MNRQNRQNARGAIFVLAVFAAIIIAIYFFFIVKDPQLHSGDSGGTAEMNTSTPQKEAVSAIQTPEPAASATPQPGLSRKVAALAVAEQADVIFVAAAAENGAACDFYAFQKDGGRWTMSVQTTGFVGKNGVNYGERVENDYTTPGGIYRMGLCFGILSVPGGMKLDYQKVDADCYWDGDRKSDTYNQLVQGSDMPAGWDAGASEHLTEYVEQYRYCMNIEYNTDPAVPGRGFAIFLHCTKDGMVQTAGCVAIPPADMVTCLEMATENTYIVILQDIEDLEDIGK